MISGPTFTGGISNAGTISGAFYGIYIDSVAVFDTGITNSGSISAGNNTAVRFSNGTSFSGGIVNGSAQQLKIESRSAMKQARMAAADH